MPAWPVGTSGCRDKGPAEPAQPSRIVTREEMLDRNAVHFRWRDAAARADIEDVRLHDLRHFYASGLIAQVTEGFQL